MQVPPVLPLTALPAQVLVLDTCCPLRKGRREKCQPSTRVKEYLTAVFSPGTEELVVTSGK